MIQCTKFDMGGEQCLFNEVVQFTSGPSETMRLVRPWPHHFFRDLARFVLPTKHVFSNSGCIVGFSASLEVPLQPVISEQRAARSGRGNALRLLDSTAHAQSACIRNAHVYACMNVAC